ncbi:L-lactate permease [Paucilactobacillus hokkaidonensis JCM 18461]|uniref:L-lactate permease n=2 Tax=Paucilactobacillus hokkaidonensis TaxID=1193095 RepID=A0A0A1GX10_9LACO|nr:lactate permease LctP family transporter [Paucilactobacillus hokkaidonensis]BAP84991.1 L-lactate permease [Paucilactobacillus hokkaidonensis JCM 18461]
MATWTQTYNPLNNIWLSAAIALIPIIFFFLALTVFKLKGYVAGFWTVTIAVLVALFLYKMPFVMAIMALLYGFMYGIWPISWIIVTSIFLYKISVKTGYFDLIRASVLSITNDHRLLVILVGFSFGAFLEGAAGFGAPVAITAALLVGLGLKPLYAAGLCLIANTAPVAFGAMGIPIAVSGQVTGISASLIGEMAGRQLPFMAVFVPFFIVFLMDGFKGIRQTWPALTVAGVSFATTQFLTSRYLGPQLPDITSALVSLVLLAAFLQIWQPKEIFQTNSGPAKTTEELNLQSGVSSAPESVSSDTISDKPSPSPHLTFRRVVKAWSPFIILTMMVVIWTQDFFKKLFLPGGLLEKTTFSIHIPFLDQQVLKATPIVSHVTPYEAVLKIDLIQATGTAILLAGIISIILLNMKPKVALQTFGETIRELALPILSIGLVLSFAFIANYSGLSSTLALALSKTGKAFPFFSPFLGWMGVFLTGSDTSANALFSNLQAITAHQIGVPDVLLVAANTTGGVTGKMISPQSIAVAAAAVGLVGKESDLFRFTVKSSLFFLVFAGIITVLQAYVFPWMIP